MSPLTRRAFLIRSLWASGLLGFSGGLGYFFHNRRKSIKPLSVFKDHREGLAIKNGTVIVHGMDIPWMVEAALKPFGGMESLVNAGETLLIKPNVAWDRKPEQAANTHPEVIAALTRMALAAGAGKVVIADIACNDPRKTFDRSGIRAAAEAAGANVVIPETYEDVAYGGSFIQTFPTGKVFLQADRIINVPIVKHHSLTETTLGMKNWYGLLGGRRHKLHQMIHESIVDLSVAVKPTFTVVDATRILMANGPQGGKLDNVKTLNLLAAGTDQVALDAWGAGLLGLNPLDLTFIRLARAAGLGTHDFRSTLLEEVDLAS